MHAIRDGALDMGCHIKAISIYDGYDCRYMQQNTIAETIEFLYGLTTK